MAVATATPISRKLSTKIIMGQTVNANLLAGAKSVDLYVIAGIANRIETGESDFGPWVAFKGEFIARRVTDGAEFRSFKVHVPEPLQGMLLEQLGAVDDRGRPVDEDGKPVKKSVEFAFMVGMESDNDTAIGFQYTARPLLEAQESDQLSGLLERVAVAEPKALPAPTRKRAKKDE